MARSAEPDRQRSVWLAALLHDCLTAIRVICAFASQSTHMADKLEQMGKGSTDRHDERMVNPAVLGDGQSAPRSVGVAHGAPWPTGRYVPIRACRPRTAIGGTMADGHDRSCSGIASHLGRVTSLAGTNLPHVGAGSGPGRSTL